MPGRSREKVHIVNPQEILTPNEILNENHTVFSLHDQLNDTKFAISWCAERRLIRNSMKCNNCQRLSTFTVINNIKNK